jgi:hypothetical protein
MTIFTDPRAFNILIIVMFLAASIRWACAGGWMQAGYWLSAAVLNVFVTAMAK